jgi:hypothetical protein
MASDHAYCSWKSAWIVPRIVKIRLRSQYLRLEIVIA